MAANDLSPDEMESRQIARLKDLKPTKHDYVRVHDIPLDAYEMVAAKNIYLLMAP
ncbi:MULTISPECIES: hypothetical protein [unclassified Caballeronia]|uniref:hypothetical protein n=1 Tax=unclassified Caballeronia TaxID=2646786 RepID=UPI0028582DFF|nr:MULTISPECIES: hypothetical protein [unclassified Caballeronia]MDR5777180.1 hypothetical protein [Caballeronia sp. LZ002]MDR5852595.1 hypothetical protein [Caballeronia sp. LZ003]